MDRKIISRVRDLPVRNQDEFYSTYNTLLDKMPKEADGVLVSLDTRRAYYWKDNTETVEKGMA